MFRVDVVNVVGTGSGSDVHAVLRDSGTRGPSEGRGSSGVVEPGAGDSIVAFADCPPAKNVYVMAWCAPEINEYRVT
ncbi:hypothetical protein [Candidatus Korobacter versatilis]|uniref:hypothetical protein n=1 Tax=Candidatus Korobacter versatilis TaxID=658062 RepID=UPI0011D0D6E5|nr:hypothetical protein [Candidatus Koribacter versatilis]